MQKRRIMKRTKDKKKGNLKTLHGIAGVHHVVSELSRRGMIALPTTRNTAGFDIIVMSIDGKKHANIQVKTSFTDDSFLPMGDTPVKDGKQDYYVLLKWRNREKRFEGFMLLGREAHAEVQRMISLQKKNIEKGDRKKIFPSIHVGGIRADEQAVDIYRQRWEKWKL